MGLGFHTLGQQMLAEMHHAAQLGERQRPVAIGFADQRLREHECVRLHLEQRRRNAEQPLAQRVRCNQRRFAPDHQPAGRPCATTHGGDRSVAGDHPHLLEPQAQRIRDQLRHAGVAALALVGRAGNAGHPARGFEPQRASVAAGDLDARRAVEPGAGRGHLHECGDPDAEVASGLPSVRLLGTQPVVIHQLQQPVKAALVRQIPDLDASGGLEWIDARPSKIPAAHLGRIDAEFGRRRVHEMLGDAAGNRLSDAAVGADQGFVLEYRA